MTFKKMVIFAPPPFPELRIQMKICMQHLPEVSQFSAKDIFWPEIRSAEYPFTGTGSRYEYFLDAFIFKLLFFGVFVESSQIFWLPCNEIQRLCMLLYK
jgi:hypothetical protein